MHRQGILSYMKRMLAVLMVLAYITGCDFQSETKPSILVVAVEGLGFDAFNCDSEQLQDRDMTGFKAFCEESVRFTHAFAPSTMSQSTMASILTGLNPIEHGVRDNGSHFLSATFETLPELAAIKGYRTLFVSGGPPIWRKSGLVQGFEIFDDNMDISPGRYYRAAGEVVQVFSNWLTREVEAGPFVSVLYLSDLQFPAFATESADGEAREQTLSGQTAEVSESLGQMVQFLKDNRRWHSTTVILVGTNSLSRDPLSNEPMTMNLKSSALQVALYVKPARKERDAVQQWTIDKSVSLVDLGWTLFSMMGREPRAAKWQQIQPISLAMSFNAPSATWSENRLLIAESGWPQWVSSSGVRYAVRQSQFLYIHDRQPQIFNTLTDRLESVRLASTDPLWSSLNQDVINFAADAQLSFFSPIDSVWSEQLELARTLWAPTRDSVTWDSLWQHINQNPHQGPWLRWGARLALREGRWTDLQALGVLAQDDLWLFVSKSNLGEHTTPPKDPCLKTFVTGLGSKPVDCKDDAVLALWDWMKAENDEARGAAREKFVRLYLQSWTDDQLGILNYQNDLRWDVRKEFPQAPTKVDLILALKEFDSFRQKVQYSLSNIDVRF